MKHRYRFPIKGSYYYSADQAFEQQLLQIGKTLSLRAEPDNSYDYHALQIWTGTIKDSNENDDLYGYLIGYVPRQLAKRWHSIINDSTTLTLTRANAKGKLLRLECEIELSLNWLQHLQLISLALWLRQQYALKGWWRSLFHS